MADELSIALLDLLRKADAEDRADFVRTAMERLAQQVIEVETDQRVGAARYERAESRQNSRNGSRPRDWDTTAGTVHLRIPKLRKGFSGNGGNPSYGGWDNCSGYQKTQSASGWDIIDSDGCYTSHTIQYDTQGDKQTYTTQVTMP